MKIKFLMLLLLFITVSMFLAGCATEYYPPQGDKDFTKVDGKIRGPVKREGFTSWSNGIGKNLPLSNPSFSLIGK